MRPFVANFVGKIYDKSCVDLVKAFG